MRPRPQTGVALVLVLWALALLSVIAGNFAYSMRTEAHIARNLLRVAQAQAAADAGVQRALFELQKPAIDPDRWQADGVAHAFTLDGMALQVSIVAESGKIDLNVAPPTLLKGLLLSVGLNEADSTALLEQLRPPNAPPAPFETVDDIQRIAGMNTELFQKLAPALTVYADQPALNAQAAPRAVLLAIPGASPDQVDQYLQQRQDAAANGLPPPPFPGNSGLVVNAGIGPGAAYGVRSAAQTHDGIGFVRQAVVRLHPDIRRPPLVLAWGEESAPPAATPGARP